MKRQNLIAVRVDEEITKGLDLARQRLMRSRSTQAALYIRQCLEQEGILDLNGRLINQEPEDGQPEA